MVTAGSLAGCGEEETAGVSRAFKAEASVGCAQRAEPATFRFDVGLPGTYSATIGDATLVFAPPPKDFSPVRMGLTRRGPEYFFWKTPIVLSADESVVVAVDPNLTNHLRLRYDHRDKRFADLPQSVRFASCAPDVKQESGKPVGEQTGWPGSMVSDRPLCARFEVRRDGSPPKSVSFALGRTCPVALPRRGS